MSEDFDWIEDEEIAYSDLRAAWDAQQEEEYEAYMAEQERLYYAEFGHYEDEGLPEDSTRYAEEEDWSEDDFPR